MKLPRTVQATFFVQTLSAGFLWVAGILIARMLGPDGQGAVATTLALLTMLVAFGNLGIGQTAIYFLGRNVLSHDKLFSFALYYAVSAGLLLSLLGWTIFSASDFEGIGARQLPVVFFIPFLLLHNYINDLFRAQLSLKMYNLWTTMRNGLYVFSLALAFLVTDLSTVGVVYLWGLSTVASLAGATIVYIRRHQPSLCLINRDELKQVISYGALISFILSLVTIMYRIDIFMVNKFLGAWDTGIYAVAVTLAQLCWFFPNSITTVLFPYIARNQNSGSTRVTEQACRIAFTSTLIFALPLLVVGPRLFTFVYGPRFEQAFSAFVYLLPGVAFFTAYKIIWADLSGKGRVKVAVPSIVTATILNILLNLLLIPRMGIEGAAIASTVAYSLATIMLMHSFRQQFHVRPIDMFVPKLRDFDVLLASLTSGHHRGIGKSAD